MKITRTVSYSVSKYSISKNERDNMAYINIWYHDNRDIYVKRKYGFDIEKYSDTLKLSPEAVFEELIINGGNSNRLEHLAD